MADKAERVTIKIHQRTRNLRVYYIDDILLATGDSDIITRGDDLDDVENLTTIGHTLAARLLDYPGVDMIKLFNYQLQVCKAELFSWSGQHDLDRVILLEIVQAISDELESVNAEVAKLLGEEPCEVELEVHLVGDPARDNDQADDEDDLDEGEAEDGTLAA